MRDPYEDIEIAPSFMVHFVGGIHVIMPTSLPHDVFLYDGQGVLRSATAQATGEVIFPFYWLEDWRVVIKRDGAHVYEHRFNPSGQRVLVSIGSSSMGDTLAWVPYLENFQQRWGCKVVACSHHNEWVESAYPSIEWIGPGVEVKNIYALTNIGFFYDESEESLPDPTKHSHDPRTEPLQWTAARQLGLPPVEIRPRVSISTRGRPVDDHYVCLGIHSTSQAKYWNHPSGWDEVTSWLKSRGYRVFIASREEDGFMGNRLPADAERLPDYQIETTATFICHADAFIGVGSGLTWMAWALETPTVLVSGFSHPWTEMSEAVKVSAPDNVCAGCFNRHRIQANDWQWCPDRKGTSRQFECSRSITPEKVISAFQQCIDEGHIS
jgi:autotransporter strand-loop-strand O-heptosyltransferase